MLGDGTPDFRTAKFRPSRRYLKNHARKLDPSCKIPKLCSLQFLQNNCATFLNSLILGHQPSGAALGKLYKSWRQFVSPDPGTQRDNANVPVPDDTLTLRTRNMPNMETSSVILQWENVDYMAPEQKKRANRQQPSLAWWAILVLCFNFPFASCTMLWQLARWSPGFACLHLSLTPRAPLLHSVPFDECFCRTIIASEPCELA